MSEDARVLCEWIDRTLGLPVYQNVARDSYAEGVVDTLRTVRKLVSRPTDPYYPDCQPVPHNPLDCRGDGPEDHDPAYSNVQGPSDG